MRKILALVSLTALLCGCWLIPEEDEQLLTFSYLGYTDYYDGITIALKYDIKNATEKTITAFRPEITITFRYDDGSGTYYPDITETILPGVTLYSYWIPVCSGYVFHQSHSLGKVMVWYDDGTTAEYQAVESSP